MMKRQFHICTTGIAVLSIILFASCANTVFEHNVPPYALSKPISNAGKKEGYYNFAGIEFNYMNTTDKTVNDLAISCIVYDSDTKKNPFIGSNIVKFHYKQPIQPQTSQQMIIPLDAYMFVAPTKPYLLDFFTVSSIAFSDGTTWADKNCTYYTRSY
jgi:hypothetical protein